MEGLQLAMPYKDKNDIEKYTKNNLEKLDLLLSKK